MMLAGHSGFLLQGVVGNPLRRSSVGEDPKSALRLTGVHCVNCHMPPDGSQSPYLTLAENIDYVLIALNTPTTMNSS